MSERPIILERWTKNGWQHQLLADVDGELIWECRGPHKRHWKTINSPERLGNWFCDYWLPDFCADTRPPSLTQE